MDNETIATLEHVANDQYVAIPTRLAAIYQIYQERGIRNPYLAEVLDDVVDETPKEN